MSVLGPPTRSSIDDIIELYRKDVDPSLIRENLKKTPEERLLSLQSLQRAAEELHRAGRRARLKSENG